jgi:alpha-tubulin suppressor-like RCC1 family protein
VKRLLVLATLGALGCGSTLLDHDADPSLLALACGQGQLACNGQCLACAPPANAQAVCSAGACGFECSAGFNACTPDACTPESPASCGPSCADCSSGVPPNGSPICSPAHACDFACEPGFLRSGDQCQRAVMISAGYEHTCALSADGRVKCWGANDAGQLGNGSNEDSATPVDALLPLPKAAKAVVCGYQHTCAILDGGTVYCWGDNTFGELGIGTIGSATSQASPVLVGGLTEVVALGAGGGVLNNSTSFGHTCAVDSGGLVQCWGANGSGQVGDGTTITRASPVPVTVVPATTAVASIACGERHTCANDAGGAVICWGANDSGQLGIGGTDPQTSPPTPAIPSGAAMVVTGQAHSCAVVSGTLECWGLNTSGQVDGGNAATGAFLSPVPALPSSVITTAAAGRSHTCAVNGAASPAIPVCFGANDSGQLGGTGSLADVALLPPATAASMTAGEDHTCLLTADGGVQCWGANDRGQLGNSLSGGPAPAYVSGL